jgi:hypothetical protein
MYNKIDGNIIMLDEQCYIFKKEIDLLVLDIVNTEAYTVTIYYVLF